MHYLNEPCYWGSSSKSFWYWHGTFELPFEEILKFHEAFFSQLAFNSSFKQFYSQLSIISSFTCSRYHMEQDTSKNGGAYWLSSARTLLSWLKFYHGLNFNWTLPSTADGVQSPGTDGIGKVWRLWCYAQVRYSVQFGQLDPVQICCPAASADLLSLMPTNYIGGISLCRL